MKKECKYCKVKTGESCSWLIDNDCKAVKIISKKVRMTYPKRNQKGKLNCYLCGGNVARCCLCLRLLVEGQNIYCQSCGEQHYHIDCYRIIGKKWSKLEENYSVEG